MCEFLGENTSVNKLNNFQKNKFKWLQDSEKYTDTTKRTYWVIIDNNFNDIERKLNKDLYDFTSKEIIEVINSIIYTSVKTNTSLISIVSSYINWAIYAGYKKGENPCKDINKSEIMMNKANTISRNIIRRKYIKLNTFFKLVDYLECSNIDKMLLVLARYGVNTQKIGNVRWEDVDSKNMVLNLNSNIQLPIDEKFLEYLDGAYKCETYDYKTSTLRY
ncbi:MAG: hypothetical protein LKH93_11095, partial [Clostridium beijerinckii]|nr:hypothetical protein [Clostridium beijerinckii]